MVAFAISVFGFIAYDVDSFGALSGNVYFSFVDANSEMCVANLDKFLFNVENITKGINMTGFNMSNLYYSKTLKKYIGFGFKEGEHCVLLADGKNNELYSLPQNIFEMKASGDYIIITTDRMNGKYSLRYYDLSTDLNNLNAIDSYNLIYESSDVIRIYCDSEDPYLVFSDQHSVYVWDYNSISEMQKEYNSLVYYGSNYYALWDDGILSVYDLQKSNVIRCESMAKPAFIYVSSEGKMIAGIADKKEVFAGNGGIAKYMKVIDLNSGDSKTLRSNFFVHRKFNGAFELN